VDAYIPRTRLHVPQETYPLDVFLCLRCGHVQLLDVVDPDVLFGDYIYLTSSSPGLVEHFRQYAENVLRLLGDPHAAFVVEVGSNDGTLLRFFKHAGMRVLGVDPAREIAEKASASGLETLPHFFTSALAREVRRQQGAATLVCANNVFAHADDLADIAEGVRHLLAPDGLFVFEVSYLLNMIEGMVFDFIYHEHLCYHSVKPLERFLRSHGLQLIDVERIPTKGGSLRGFAQLLGGPRTPSPSISALMQRETSLGLDRPEIFKAFAARIQDLKCQLSSLLDGMTQRGNTIAGYGASATTTVLTYHFNLGEKLAFLVDDNPSRQGLFSPGYHIPVLPPEAIYSRAPGCVLILVWRFAEMIMRKHQAYRDRGGRFIIPLPKIEVI
jgi:SAM-dependent methyltransferase